MSIFSPLNGSEADELKANCFNWKFVTLNILFVIVRTKYFDLNFNIYYN